MIERCLQEALHSMIHHTRATLLDRLISEDNGPPELTQWKDLEGNGMQQLVQTMNRAVADDIAVIFLVAHREDDGIMLKLASPLSMEQTAVLINRAAELVKQQLSGG